MGVERAERAGSAQQSLRQSPLRLQVSAGFAGAPSRRGGKLGLFHEPLRGTAATTGCDPKQIDITER
jgi:hypothetical protein